MRFLVHSIKVYDINSLPDTVAVVNVADDGGVEKIAWSEDGQLLAASTTYGSVLVYLSKLPMLASSCSDYICLLTTLSRVTIHSIATNEVKSKCFHTCFVFDF